MENETLHVIACIPCEFESECPEDLPGAVKHICEYCNKDMWVGPLKNKYLNECIEKDQDYFFGCLKCVLDNLHEDMEHADEVREMPLEGYFKD